ncbi:MAG: caspase family protein [Bacteroidales bacterium]|nr:caspase family protein [Bacteroidales bacterium]
MYKLKHQNLVKTPFILLLSFLYTLTANAQSTTYPVEAVIQRGHTKFVSNLAFSPDGKILASGANDHSIILWNMTNGKQLRTISTHTAKIHSLSFSANGKYLLSSGADNYAYITDIATGKTEQSFYLPKEYLLTACYSQKETYVLLKDDRDKIFVFNTATGLLVNTFETPFNMSISKTITSADDANILTSHTYNLVVIKNIITGNEVKSIPFDKARNMTYSADGKQIIVGSTKLFAETFDALTGIKKYRLYADTNVRCDGCNTSVCFSNNGKRILTSARYSGLHLWNAENGKLIRTLSTHVDEIDVDVLRFSPDDAYCISQAEDKTIVWDSNTGKKIFEWEVEGMPFEPSITEKNNLALSTLNNTIIIKQASTGKTIRELSGFMNAAANNGLSYKQNNWIDADIIKYLNIKSALAVHPDGMMIVKGKIDSAAQVINLFTGQVIFTLTGHGKQVTACAYNNAGTEIATAGADGNIIFWDSKTGKKTKTIEAHNSLIFDIAFSDDDATLVSSSWTGNAKLWDVKTTKLLKTMNFNDIAPFKTRFTPGNLYLLSSYLDKNLKLIETDALQEFRTFIGHNSVVTDFDFSNDAKSIVSSGLDGRVRKWDMLNGMLIGKFGDAKSAFNAVAYHKAGKYIACGGNDKTISILDANTFKLLYTLPVQYGAIASLHFSNNNDRLISCTTDGIIQLWDLQSQKELYTYLRIDRQNWLSKSPGGQFDGSPDALKNINYVSGLDVISIGALFEKFYSPKLIERLMKGEKFPDGGLGVLEYMKHSPEVALSLNDEDKRGELFIADTIEWAAKKIPLTFEITDKGGGVDEVRIYHNKKLVQSEFLNESVIKEGKSFKKAIELTLSHGLNNISVIALNKNRVESEPAKLNINYDGLESDVDLYLFAAGIDKYANPSYALTYATSDAKAFVKQVEQGTNQIFKTVNTFFIKDQEVTREAIEEKISTIAKQAGPEDVFLFYFAGHGVMSTGSAENAPEFYLITQDVTKLYGDDKLLDEKAISANVLLQYSKNIPAGKQLFVIDACQSGGALDAVMTRGAAREKAVAQLARSSGTFFLLASGAMQFATELKTLGHGIFTYAIIEALTGKADGGSTDNKITANELKSYVEDRVPQITEEYMLTPQYPTGYGFGQDFPLVLVK